MPLDKQRKRLERGQQDQATLIQQLTQLAEQYRSLATEAQQASPERPAKPKSKSSQTETQSYYSAPAEERPSPSSSSSYDSPISYDSGSSGGESRDGGSW